jgi:hypothetical protein
MVRAVVAVDVNLIVTEIQCTMVLTVELVRDMVLPVLIQEAVMVLLILVAAVEAVTLTV